MANAFWNFITTFTAGTLAKAEDVNTNYTGIETGFDDVETEIDKTIQVTNSPGATDITGNAAARALKIITFDANGDIAAVDDIGDWQVDHAGSTDYVVRDLVVDAAGDLGLNNVYRCNTVHTSTADMSDNTAKWDLVINVEDVETAKVAAEAAQTAAETAETNAGNSETAAAASAAELQGYDALTYAATKAFDFDGSQTQDMATVTGDLTTLTTSNRGAGKSFTLKLTASAADRDITYNASWVQLGYLPTTIPSGKTLILSFVCMDTAETDVHVTGVLER